MSLKPRYSYPFHPESPASSAKTLASFDKYPTDHDQARGSQPRLPNLEMTTVHRGEHGAHAHKSATVNDEVARMRKLKRKLFLEAVAQSAE